MQLTSSVITSPVAVHIFNAVKFFDSNWSEFMNYIYTLLGYNGTAKQRKMIQRIKEYNHIKLPKL